MTLSILPEAFTNYTIPCGVTSVHIETVGAAGATGGNSASGGSGGLGGYAAGDLAVTPDGSFSSL
jgi:hypothetical protein